MKFVKKIGFFVVILITFTTVSSGLAKYEITQQLNIYGNIQALYVSPDNQTLAATFKEGQNNKLVVFEKEGNWYPEQPVISLNSKRYKFSLDWQYLAVLTNKDEIILYSKKDDLWNPQIINDIGLIRDFAFSNLNEYLFVRTDETLKIFNTSDCSEIDNAYIFDLLRSNTNKNIAICGYTVSPDNESIATTNTQNNELQICQKDHVDHQILTFGQNEIIKYKFSHNSQMLAVLTNARNLVLFRKNNDGVWNQFQEINKNVITNFCFSQNGIAVFNQATDYYTVEGGNPLVPHEERHPRTTYCLTIFNYQNDRFAESKNYNSYGFFHPILNAPITIQQSNSQIRIVHGYGEHWETSNTYNHNNRGALLSNPGKELIILSSRTQSLDIYKIKEGQANSLPFAKIKCPDFFSEIHDVYFLDNTDIVVRLEAYSSWFFGKNSNQIIILSQRETQVKNANK